MEYTDPFDLSVPDGTWYLGEPPFWTPGQAVTWTYRRFDFDRDHIEVRRPMRVIEDGPSGAVLWMPGGAEVTDTGLVGWEGMSAHDVPLGIRFRPRAEAPERFMVPARWQGRGVLKLAPPNVPFSVWVLVKPAEAVEPAPSSPDDSGMPMSTPAGVASQAGPVRVEWYINLEIVHRRTAEAVYTSDLILDITFPVAEEPLHLSDGGLNPRGAVFKDVDEIAAAAAYGYWPPAWTDIVRSNGALVLERLEEHRWAFDPRWEDLARRLAGDAQRQRLRLGPVTTAGDGSAMDTATESGEAAAASAREHGDAAVASAGEHGKAAVASAGTISTGQGEHRRIPSGCYIRPNDR